MILTCPHCGEQIRCSRGPGAMTTHIKHVHLNKPEDRFWAKVDKDGPGGCWLYRGVITWEGYGHFDLSRRENGRRVKRQYQAHRYAWMLTNGPIPDGGLLCHKCNVRACVNPSHIYIGDHGTNAQDALAAGHYTIGEAHRSAKLTEATAIEARSRYRKTGPKESNAQELALEYGVSVSAIWHLVNGRTWKHLLGRSLPQSDGSK